MGWVEIKEYFGFQRGALKMFVIFLGQNACKYGGKTPHNGGGGRGAKYFLLHGGEGPKIVGL